MCPYLNWYWTIMSFKLNCSLTQLRPCSLWHPSPGWLFPSIEISAGEYSCPVWYFSNPSLPPPPTPLFVDCLGVLEPGMSNHWPSVWWHATGWAWKSKTKSVLWFQTWCQRPKGKNTSQKKFSSNLHSLRIIITSPSSVHVHLWVVPNHEPSHTQNH